MVIASNAQMSYQLFVEFGYGKSPTTEDVQKVLRGLDQSFEGMEGNLLRAIDSYAGDPVSIDIGQSGAVKFEVPFVATFRSVAAAMLLHGLSRTSSGEK